MIEYEKRLCKASKRDPSDEIKPPSSYTSFQKLFDQIGKPCLPIESPTADQMKPYKKFNITWKVQLTIRHQVYQT